MLTGAANALGAALAVSLADRGATVFSDTTSETVDALIELAIGHTGRLDILINGALPPAGGEFEELSSDSLAAAFRRHVTEPFAAMRKALPHMERYGRILNVVLSAGVFGVEDGAAGSAASAALIALTKCAALDVKGGDVRINALAPLVDIAEMSALFDLEPAVDRSLFRVADVLPAALYLTHDSCAVSGEVYTAGAGRVSRIAASTAPGYFQPGMSPEEFTARLREIGDPQASISPKSARGEFVLVAV